MAKKSTDTLLGSVPLLEGLSKKELKTVIKESQEERFRPGRAIVSEGKAGGRFYLLLAGTAKVTQKGRKRATLHPGDFFGEMSILDRAPRTATVTAETEVKALSVASWNFLAMMEENFSIAKKVMQALSERIRDLERSLTH